MVCSRGATCLDCKWFVVLTVRLSSECGSCVVLPVRHVSKLYVFVLVKFGPTSTELDEFWTCGQRTWSILDVWVSNLCNLGPIRVELEYSRTYELEIMKITQSFFCLSPWMAREHSNTRCMQNLLQNEGGRSKKQQINKWCLSWYELTSQNN